MPKYKLEILDVFGKEVLITDEMTDKNILLFLIRDTFNSANKTSSLENMHCRPDGLFARNYVLPMFVGMLFFSVPDWSQFDAVFTIFERSLWRNAMRRDVSGFFQSCLSEQGKAVYQQLKRLHGLPLTDTSAKLNLFFQMLHELRIEGVTEIKITEVPTAASVASPSRETPGLALRKYCAKSNDVTDPRFIELLEAVKASGTLDQPGEGSGKSALHRALEAGHFAIAARLAEAGARIDLPDGGGKLPWQYAAEWQDKLGAAAAEEDFASGGGGSGGAGAREAANAASVALFRGCESSVSATNFNAAVAVAKNHNVLERTNSAGRTAVQTVLEDGDFAKAEMLIKAGASFPEVACCIEHWLGQFPELRSAVAPSDSYVLRAYTLEDTRYYDGREPSIV